MIETQPQVGSLLSEKKVNTPDIAGEKLEARRSYIEEQLLADGALHQDLLENIEPFNEGEKIKVLSSLVEIPQNLRSETSKDKVRVTIFIPGLFQADRPNYGNHPLEVKLASTLLTGGVDCVVVLKAEGQNNLAFQDKDGNAVGQHKVAEAGYQVVRKYIQEIMSRPENLGKECEFTVVGHSEGSTQAASLVKNILDHNKMEAERLGGVKDLSIFMASGLSGAEDQNAFSPKDFLKSAVSQGKPLVEWGKKGYHHNDVRFTTRQGREAVANISYIPAVQLQGIEASIPKNPSYVDSAADVENVKRWFMRLALSEQGMGLGKKLQDAAKGIGRVLGVSGAAEKRAERALVDFAFSMGVEGDVPFARVQAAESKNTDYTSVVEAGVPLHIFAGTEDILFPVNPVLERVAELQKIPGADVTALFSNGNHNFTHEYPRGSAYMLRYIGELKRSTATESK